MKIEFEGQTVYASTGGRSFNPHGHVVVLLHGSGQSHLTWVLQGRYLAYDGFDVLAVDMPGHGLSGGEPLNTIEDMAGWLERLLDHLGVKSAALIGHSQGVLVALSAGARNPDRYHKLGLIAGALAIPVNDQLVSESENSLPEAIEKMTSWGHGQIAQMHDHSQPGHSFLFYGRQLMAANNRTALTADFAACNGYQDGEADAAKITAPCLVILAGKDKMTPKKQGLKMADALSSAQVIDVPEAGHMLPAEAPDIINQALTSFLA